MTPRREFLKALSVIAVPGGSPASIRIAFAPSVPGAPEAARAGFEIVAIGDPSSHALALPFDAPAAVAAMRAGKDVWLPTPSPIQIQEARAIDEAARRYGRIVQIDNPWRSGAAVATAHEHIRSGALGEIRFCRILGGAPMLDILQFLFDDPAPLSATSLGANHRTYRYSNMVVSQEAGAPSIAIYGSFRTLTISAPAADPLPHWRNFFDCIRTRKRPRAHLDGAIRIAVMRRMAALSLHRRVTVDWTST